MIKKKLYAIDYKSGNGKCTMVFYYRAFSKSNALKTFIVRYGKKPQILRIYLVTNKEISNRINKEKLNEDIPVEKDR